MAGITVFICAYFWIYSFLPRRIVLYDDRVSIFQVTKGYSAWIKIYYSDIRRMQVIADGKHYLIKMTLVSGKDIVFYAPDYNGVDALDNMLKGYSVVKC